MDKKMLATFGLILGGIQFLVVSTIAMCLYPGGTKVNPLTAEYSFWCNMFSDMGRTVAHNGACNTVSATLFIATMWVLAMLCVPFYLVFPSTSAFNGSEKCKKHLVIIARSLAIAASVLLALSASFPQDLFPTVHLRLAQLVFVFMGPAALIFWRLLTSSRGNKNPYAVAFLIFSIIIFSGIIITIASGEPVTELAVTTQATVQKVMVYTWNAVMFIEAFGFLKEQRDGA